MLVAGARGGLDALRENGFGVGGAIVSCEGLRVHLVAGNIIRIGTNQSLKMRFRRGNVAFFDALERDAVAGEGVIRILDQELFQFLATAFALFGHGHVSYYTCSTESVQRGAGEER